MRIIGTRASKAIDGLERITDGDLAGPGFVAKLHNRRIGLFWSPDWLCWRIVTKKLLPHRRISIQEMALREDTMHELVGLYVKHAQLAGVGRGRAWADVPALHTEIECKTKALEQILEVLGDPAGHVFDEETRAYVIARAALTIGGRG